MRQEWLLNEGKERIILQTISLKLNEEPAHSKHKTEKRWTKLLHCFRLHTLTPLTCQSENNNDFAIIDHGIMIKDLFETHLHIIRACNYPVFASNKFCSANRVCTNFDSFNQLLSLDIPYMHISIIQCSTNPWFCWM